MGAELICLDSSLFLTEALRDFDMSNWSELAPLLETGVGLRDFLLC